MWYGVDQLTEDYPSISSYAYCGNSPVVLIDPDGKKISLPTQNQATTIVNDLNAIYSDKYKVNNVFSVQKVNITKKVRTNDWNLTSPSTWKNIFIKPEYKEVVVRTDYRIVKTSNFDKIKGDKYTNALSEMIDSKINVRGEIIADSKRGGNLGFLKGYGGGLVTSSTSFELSDNLSKYGDKGTKGKFAYKWSLGGVFLHENLYHLHTLGSKEQFKEGANGMRKYYNSKTGKEHGAGNKALIGN